METGTIEFVSGLKVEVRKHTLGDENALANARRKIPEGDERLLYMVLDRLTVSVVDPGPYPFLSIGDTNVPWKKVLTGDVISGVLAVRKHSYKDGNLVIIPDIKCPSCKKTYNWKLNIDEELPVQRLPDEDIEAIKNNEDLQIELSNGVKLTIAPDNGEAAGRFNKLIKKYPDRSASVELRCRIVDVSVDGENVDRSKILDWLDGGSGFDGITSELAQEIRDELTFHNCGIDLEFEAECREYGCAEPSHWMALPFGTLVAGNSGTAKRKLERRRNLRNQKNAQAADGGLEG